MGIEILVINDAFTTLIVGFLDPEFPGVGAQEAADGRWVEPAKAVPETVPVPQHQMDQCSCGGHVGGDHVKHIAAGQPRNALLVECGAVDGVVGSEDERLVVLVHIRAVRVTVEEQLSEEGET